MAKYISVTETAKLIRSALKDAFKKQYPQVKFSVRSNSYAGGASIDISWVDGPCDPDVESVVKRFQGASFDGMTDSTTYHTSTLNGEEVHFGSDYVHTRRKFSSAFVETIAKQFCERRGIPMFSIRGSENDAYADTYRLDYETEHSFHQLLHKTDAKNMNRAYKAQEESQARAQAKYEAEVKAQAAREAKERAEAQAKAEQEKKQREQAEFAQWQREQFYNEAWQQEQFKKWKEENAKRKAEQERKAREEAEHKRQEQQRQYQEQQQREQVKAQKYTILSSKSNALAFFGLSLNANRQDILQAFRAKVKASADGDGGYTGDMDLLVKAKEKALQS